jgi:hypothetical protein
VGAFTPQRPSASSASGEPRSKWNVLKSAIIGLPRRRLKRRAAGRVANMALRRVRAESTQKRWRKPYRPSHGWVGAIFTPPTFASGNGGRLHWKNLRKGVVYPGEPLHNPPVGCWGFPVIAVGTCSGPPCALGASQRK